MLTVLMMGSTETEETTYLNLAQLSQTTRRCEHLFPWLIYLLQRRHPVNSSRPPPTRPPQGHLKVTLLPPSGTEMHDIKKNNVNALAPAHGPLIVNSVGEKKWAFVSSSGRFLRVVHIVPMSDCCFKQGRAGGGLFGFIRLCCVVSCKPG